MTQYSLFGDDNFEEPPKKTKKAAPKKTEPFTEANELPVTQAEMDVNEEPLTVDPILIQTADRPIPQGDVEVSYELDEKNLEENYVREVFIFEEPVAANETEEIQNDETENVETETEEIYNEETEIAEIENEETDFEEITSDKGVPKAESVIISKTTRGRLKLSNTHLAAGSIAVPEDEILFSKKYYGIGIVAKMFDVNISLLRYWENEFTILKPRKNGKGDRHFRPEDIKNLQLIHHLLREKKYTLEGAKDFLKKTKKTEDPLAIIENLKDLKSFLLEIKTNL